MQPYYHDDRNGITIYHADAREVLPTLGKVDGIVTDPPYGIGYETSRRSRGDPLRCPVLHDSDLQLVANVWPVAIGLLRENRHWYAFASPQVVAEAQRIYRPKQWLFWDKGDRGTVGDLVAGYGECVELIAYGMKGRRALFGKRPRNIIRYDWWGARDPQHPTVKPVPLLARLIANSTKIDELVLDPFLGSGTTLSAAKQLGRRACGIELSEEYCEIAARRLSQETINLPDPEPRKPEQLGLLK